MAIVYPWKRFWCARDGRLNLSDQGFLADPEDKHGKVLNPDVVPFEAIVHLPCLALLGELGIGKSTAIADERKSVEAELLKKGERSLSLDLGEYGDETRLVRDVFESVVFRDWQSGTFRLHIFLDGLDECRIQIPQVGKLLAGQFEKVRDSLSRLSRTFLADQARALCQQGVTIRSVVVNAALR